MNKMNKKIIQGDISKLSDVLSDDIISINDINIKIRNKFNIIYETTKFCLVLYMNYIYIMDIQDYYLDTVISDIGNDIQQIKSLMNILENDSTYIDIYIEYMKDLIKIREIYIKVIGKSLNELNMIPEIRQYMLKKKAKKYNL